MQKLISHLPQFKDSNWQADLKKAFYWGLAFHILAIIFSDGFHRPDEHLGIMRFTGYKLGMLSSEQAFSSWEYPAQIRPWLQPFLYTMFITPFQWIGVKNPFFIAGLLRAFTSMFGILASYLMAVMSYDWASSQRVRKVLLYSSFLLWFLPFFHARTSAENLGSSFFTFGFFLTYLFLKKDRLPISTSLWIGMLFALSFITRYQMSVCVFFICLWLLIVKREKISSLSAITLSFFATLLLTSLINRWGYGEWTNPAYNYFYQNIILGKSSHFGVDPWWKYITKSISKGIPPLSLFYFCASIYFWVKKPKDILTWVTLPFLVIHSLIAHKELRFIFPALLYLPLLSGLLLERWSWVQSKKFVWRTMATFNGAALLIASLKTVYSPLGFYKFLYRHPQKIEQIYTLNVVRDQLNFYQKNAVELIYIKDRVELKDLSSIWILTDKMNDREYFSKKKECINHYSSYPSWLIDFFPKIFKRSKIWTLFYCGQG